MLEKLKKYETEISEMSKEISKVNMLQSQLNALKEDIENGTEREKKLKMSNLSLQEKINFLESEMEDTSSKLLIAEQEVLHEKTNSIRMKEEGYEKMKMLHEAHETNVQNEVLISSLKSEITAAKEKENEGLKEFATLTVSLHKANTECNLKSEELEKIKIRLGHLNSELDTTKSQLRDLENVKEENLTLKKSLMSLETEHQVIWTKIIIGKCFLR